MADIFCCVLMCQHVIWKTRTNKVYTSIMFVYPVFKFQEGWDGWAPIRTKLPSLPSHPKNFIFLPRKKEKDAKKHQEDTHPCQDDIPKWKLDVSPKVKTSYQCISPTFTHAINKAEKGQIISKDAYDKYWFNCMYDIHKSYKDNFYVSLSRGWNRFKTLLVTATVTGNR